MSSVFTASLFSELEQSKTNSKLKINLPEKSNSSCKNFAVNGGYQKNCESQVPIANSHLKRLQELEKENENLKKENENLRFYYNISFFHKDIKIKKLGIQCLLILQIHLLFCIEAGSCRA